MSGKKLKNQDALNFITAGNSEFTFKNSKTCAEFSYKIKISDDGSVFFVRVLKDDSYKYIGFIRSNKFGYTNKSNLNQNDQEIKVFKWVFDKLIDNKLPEFIEVWHLGKCGKCGRKLKNSDSIDLGIGPECIKKLGKRGLRALKLQKLGI